MGNGKRSIAVVLFAGLSAFATGTPADKATKKGGEWDCEDKTHPCDPPPGPAAARGDKAWEMKETAGDKERTREGKGKDPAEAEKNPHGSDAPEKK